MMSGSDVAKAVSAALLFGWAVYTELRLRVTQESLVKTREALIDANIEANTKSLSDDQLRDDLDNELGTKNGKSNS